MSWPRWLRLVHERPPRRSDAWVDACWTCGQLGHWAESCPVLAKTSESAGCTCGVADRVAGPYAAYAHARPCPQWRGVP